MTRITESQLLDFCTRQHEIFDSAEWREFSAVDRLELAATALFLSGVDWFGHREELPKITAELFPDWQGRFRELVSETNFDCSRFSNMLRRRPVDSRESSGAI
ncbi:MAG: hypothetical protein ACI9R3_001573 [Verrucomicrobiales bacterium]|jgi:hypothetical protein